MAEELDPKITRRYRQLGEEEPPRELDQAILAAAHRAAGRAHAPLVTPAGRHRWYFAFGAAAILVLAVAITVQMERQPDPEAPPPSQAAVPSERVDNFYSRAEKESKGQVEPSRPLAEAGRPPVRERRKPSPQHAAPAVSPPPEVKPQEAEEARAETPASGTLSRQQEARRAEPHPAAAPSPEATTKPQAKEDRVVASVASLTPERLLERVAELRKEGRHDEADKALAEFRQRYPDYRISDEVLKKVERAK